MTPSHPKWAVCFCAAALLTMAAGPVAAKQWSAEKVRVIEGLSAPESVLADPANGPVYISNIECAPGESWNNDARFLHVPQMA